MELSDFKCGYDGSFEIIGKIASAKAIQILEAYTKWDSMAFLSKEIKEHDNSGFCILPLCSTIEGEAMGGRINYGDSNAGPRAKEYVCSNIEELLNLPSMDFAKGRFAEVLKACRYLREEGENVVLNISGPFTIMNLLIELRHVFKAFRKEPKTIEAIFEKFQNEILGYVEKAQREGVKLISYGDPVGGDNILGPTLSRQVVEMFTYPLLRKIQGVLQEDVLVLLCPKTTFMLLETKKAVVKEIALGEPMIYSEACVKITKQASFVGQTCINNKNLVLKDGIIRSINLKF